MLEDYSVYVKRIWKISTSTIGQEERQFWKESIEAQESSKSRVDLWE